MDTNKGTADTHFKNVDIHVTAAKKSEWDAKAPGSTQVDLKAHTDNADIHVTAAKKAEWDGKAPGSTATDLVNHQTNKVVHLTQDDHDKLDGIEEGAQVNQNAFAKVNDIEAADPSSQLYIVEGIGIRVTTNLNTGEITITATGDAAPGAHGTTHTEHGADPIPTATLTEGGLLSAAQFAEIVTHGELLEEHADAISAIENTIGSAADVAKRLDEATTAILTLKPGLNDITPSNAAPASVLAMKGSTSVNIQSADALTRKMSGTGTSLVWTGSQPYSMDLIH